VDFAAREFAAASRYLLSKSVWSAAAHSVGQWESVMAGVSRALRIAAARKEGRIGGRPPKLRLQQRQEIVSLVRRGRKTAVDAARLFDVHPATIATAAARVESSSGHSRFAVAFGAQLLSTQCL
jgi:hypothetical protein